MEHVISPESTVHVATVPVATVPVATVARRWTGERHDFPPLGSGGYVRNFPHQRSGIASFELVVTATLLLVLMSIVAQVSTACGQLWQDARSYRLASTELATQLERLTLLPEEQVRSELANWRPSQALQQVLPAVELQGEVISDDDGPRLKLTINWQRRHNGPPLVLIGWLVPRPMPASEEG